MSFDLDDLRQKEYNKNKMNCWHCGTEVIWGADFDMEDVNDGEESEYDFFSTFTCPKCESYIEVYHKSEK